MKCQYPYCKSAATTNWALVRICQKHRDLIWRETFDHYNRYSGLHYGDRKHFLKIAKKIPWSQLSKGEWKP